MSRSHDPRERARLAAIVESAREAIVSKDPRGVIQSWNPAAERIYGWTAEEAIGRHISFIVPEDRMAEIEANHERLRRGEKVEPYETKRVTKDGRVLDIRLSLTPILDDDGELVSIAAVTQDITESKRIERELRLSEERFRTALRGSPITVFNQDRSMRYTWVYNPPAPLSVDELVGRSDRELFEVPDEVEHLEGLKRQVLDEGRTCREEVKLTLGGSVRHFHVTLEPRHDLSGRIVGVTGAAMDLTAQKRIEAALARADRQKDTFIALLAHELRNPLNALRSGIEVLRRGSASDPTLILEDLDREIGAVARLLDDLLDTSRIIHGKFELQTTPGSVAELLSRVDRSVRSADEEGGPALEIDPVHEELWIEADLQRIEQVLCNLLENAVHHTPEGGTVRVEVETRGDDVLFFVRDTGRGFRSEEAEAIFEPFHQGGQDAEENLGLGLGLGLAREIAELHGGTLVASSRGEGEGSTFRLLLPEALTRAPESRPAEETAHERAGATPRILLVDDEETSAKLMEIVLQDEGHEVRIAHSGEEALDQCEAFSPEVVLLDLRMPGIDGYETIRRIRKMATGKSARIYAFTGFNDPGTLHAIEKAGFDGHILKGGTIDEIRAALLDGLSAPEES